MALVLRWIWLHRNYLIIFLTPLLILPLPLVLPTPVSAFLQEYFVEMFCKALEHVNQNSFFMHLQFVYVKWLKYVISEHLKSSWMMAENHTALIYDLWRLGLTLYLHSLRRSSTSHKQRKWSKAHSYTRSWDQVTLTLRTTAEKIMHKTLFSIWISYWNCNVNKKELSDI